MAATNKMVDEARREGRMVARGLSLQKRREVLAQIWPQYREALALQKLLLLDSFTQITQYHRIIPTHEGRSPLVSRYASQLRHLVLESQEDILSDTSQSGRVGQQYQVAEDPPNRGKLTFPPPS